MNMHRSPQPVAGSQKNLWIWSVILLCVLALAPILSANDDGEILDASIVLTVSPDYKVKEEVTITKRLLSYQALDTDGDPRTPYCGALQTLTITKARVTTPGGKVVDCTPNALNLSTPDALVAHPELSNWQEMVVTFLGLEPGAQTELSYIREDKSAFRTTFEKKQVLAWHFPIRKGTVTVRLPKGMNLTYQIMNFKGEASANPVADLMEYTFIFKDIPAYSDRDMHNGMAFLPTLYLTTTPSWEEAGKRLQEIAEKYGSPDEAITKKAKGLTKDATTDLDKAVAIHKFVKEQFKEVEWPLQDSLLLFHDAAKTYAAGQGTNLELALLLKAMAVAAGVKAELALTGPEPFAAKASGLMAFDRAVVLGMDNLDLFLDPSGDPGPESPGQSFLAQGATIPMTHPSEGKAVLSGDIELKGDKLTGSAHFDLSGTFNPYWVNLEGEDVLKSAMKPWLPFPKLEIKTLQPRKIDSENSRLDVEFEATIDPELREIRLLPETKAFLPGIDLRTAVSALPMLLPKLMVSIQWNTKNIESDGVPTINLFAQWGGMIIERSRADQGTRVIARFFTPPASNPLLAPADYPSLQAALAVWQNPVVAGVLLP